jgi:CcmD family protein
MENAGYVFAAFAVIWALVFGFLLFLVSRQRKLRQEIDSLRETIKEKEIGQ